MIVGTVAMSAGMVITYDWPTRGPVLFDTGDTDNSGTIDEQKIKTVCEPFQAAIRSANPDTDQVTQLTCELLELHAKSRCMLKRQVSK